MNTFLIGVHLGDIAVEIDGHISCFRTRGEAVGYLMKKIKHAAPAGDGDIRGELARSITLIEDIAARWPASQRSGCDNVDHIPF